MIVRSMAVSYEELSVPGVEGPIVTARVPQNTPDVGQMISEAVQYLEKSLGRLGRAHHL